MLKCINVAFMLLVFAGFWSCSNERNPIMPDSDSYYGKSNTIRSFTELASSKYALRFDGINDFIDFGNVDELEFGESDFTISFWMRARPSLTNEQMQLIRKGYDNQTTGEARWVIKLLSNGLLLLL